MRSITESVAAHAMSVRTVEDRNQRDGTQAHQDSLTLSGAANPRLKTWTSRERVADRPSRSSQREELHENTG